MPCAGMSSKSHASVTCDACQQHRRESECSHDDWLRVGRNVTVEWIIVELQTDGDTKTGRTVESEQAPPQKKKHKARQESRSKVKERRRHAKESRSRAEGE